ncbi:MAG: hypothetical protein FWF78_02035, partial [Defluviitaleaceae bacterium]|nr:hypothetical protein [Defluviitaleaceae bacterium]
NLKCRAACKHYPRKSPLNVFSIIPYFFCRHTLERKVHGSLTIGDNKYISAWDFDYFVRQAARHGDRSILRSERGFDTFFPYGIEINSAYDAWVAFMNEVRVLSDNLRFDTIMVFAFSMLDDNTTVFYAPAKYLDDIEGIQISVGWN